MNLEFKKRKKGILERIFTYPSFNLRFGLSLGVIFILATAAVVLVIYRTDNWQHRLVCFGLLIQAITLVFGIVAAFFALQQLTESRHSKLQEIGSKDVRDSSYFSAIRSWKEALYIKPTSSIFLNLMETCLMAEELKYFDELVKYLEKKKSFQQKIITEPKELILYWYLRVFRGLVVENMGEAKEHLEELLMVVKKEGRQASLGWNFEDIRRGPSYSKLVGDHKIIADNLLSYLEGKMSLGDTAKFEAKDYIFPSSTVNPLIIKTPSSTLSL